MQEIAATARGVVLALLPLAVLFLVFQIFMLNLPRKQVRTILVGTLLSAAGLFLFLLGVGLSFLPFGRIIGEALGAIEAQWLLLPIGMALGFFTTWSEPSMRILVDQVEQASNGSVRGSLVMYTVCVGVAAWVGLGLLRIAYEIPLLYLLVPGYIFVLAVMWFCDRAFVSIAVDAGGVATGPMANTFLLALALGVSASIGGQNPVLHGLGLVSLIALAPVASLMTLGVLIRRKARGQE